MSDLRDKYAIVGTGKSRLGRVEGASGLGLLVEAIKQALDEAGLTNKDVDGLLIRGPDDIYSLHQLYVVALIELDEGLRLVSNIVGMPPGRVVCEMPVRIVYENINENVTLPKFAAAS